MIRIWREVVNVKVQDGSLNGRIWFLELSCGRHAVRRIPRLRLHNLTQFERLEPPAKCHCVLCEIDAIAGQK